MPATKIIVIVLAFIGGSLSGVWLHPLLGALFSTALMLVLVLPVGANTGESTNPIRDEHPSHNLLLQEISQILNAVIQDTQKNLASQIAIQSDAIALLIQSFESIKTLLEAHPQLDGIARAIAELNNVARALQFEDMSRQNMEYSAVQLHELQPLIAALKIAAQYPEQLDAELVRYKNSELRHKHNPVSATSVKSGSIDLF